MNLTETWSRVMGTWNAIEPRRRLVVAAMATAVFVLLIGWGFFASRPEYTVLYNRLETQDAAGIVDALDAQGHKYRLADNGRTVLVNARDVHQVRLQLASEGLPSLGTPGFELLDGVSIGATDFERRNNYIRALAGELARTVSRIAQVDSARVHIVLPEQSLFTSQSRPTTAAVFIQHKPNAHLAADQIEGIIHLVAHSVEGLERDMVTVVDESGRVLEGNGLSSTPSSAQRAVTQVEASSQFSRELEGNLQRMLEQVLGPGNVATRVAAELSFDESVVNRRMFEPVSEGEGIVRSIQELYESSRGIGGADGGAAGTQSNVPLYQVATAEGSYLSESEKQEVVKNFEVNEIVEHTVIAPGAVKRLSVSVVVNSELAPAQITGLERLVAAAVGSDERRADQIVVTGMQFNTDLAQTVATDIAVGRRNQLIAIAVGAALALLAGMVLLVRGRRSAKQRLGAQRVVVAQEVLDELPPIDQTRQKAQEELYRLFRSQPQAAVEVIRSWLVEDGER